MKRFIAGLFVGITLAPVAMATESGPNAVCEDWASKAGSYMLFRQMNTPIHEAMQNAMGNVTRGLLLRAYQSPVEETNEGKQQVIDEFKQQIMEECLSGQSQP